MDKLRHLYLAPGKFFWRWYRWDVNSESPYTSDGKGSQRMTSKVRNVTFELFQC